MKSKITFLKNIIKGKRGGSTLLEIMVSLGLITFILFYPIATYSLAQKENMLEDILATSIQMVSVEGGLTDRVEDVIFLNLEAKGLIPKDSHDKPEIREKIRIKSNADARKGDIENLIYRDDDDPKIFIEIWYPANTEISLMNGLSKIIGASGKTLPFRDQDGDGNWYYKHKGYILSEKIDY
jgi:hypothetical protein